METDEAYREECKDYINCDYCHRYAPTRWCAACGTDCCRDCAPTHAAEHEMIAGGEE